MIRYLGLILAMILLAPPGSEGQVHAPSIPEEAAVKGGVWRTQHVEYRYFSNIRELVSGSVLIIRGMVLSEATRLSSDQRDVITAYRIQLLDVLHNPEGVDLSSGTIVVSKSGGNMTVDGRPVRVDTPDFPGLRTWATYVLFIGRTKDRPNLLWFVGGPQGVFELRDDHVRVKMPPGKQLLVFEGMRADDFVRLVKSSIEANKANPVPVPPSRFDPECRR